MDNSLDKYYEFNEISRIYIKKGKLTELQILNLKEIIKPIIDNPQWIKIKNYPHHNNDNRGIHIIKVCFSSYKIALKNKRCEVEKIVLSAMLHDFFDYDWTTLVPKKKITEKHGYTHPKASLEESLKYFPELIDDKVKDAILSHMWPLSKMPKYRESWIVKWSDFKTSLEILSNPKDFPKYIGLERKKLKR
jgi:uncharacterized protein